MWDLSHNMAAVQPILDHIVILVPHETLLNLPLWISEAFTVLTGGRHADGVTENKLIVLQDGVYLELIAFIPGKETERKSHRWGQRREGHIVDWANTLHNGADLEVIRSRVAAAGSGIKYTAPSAGGRVRPDGTELQWTISAPYADDDKVGAVAAFAGGEAPFWCLDRTPRNLRVPHQVESNVKHASGAVGVAGVTVSVRDAKLLKTLKETYDALQGKEGRILESKGDSAARAYVWDLVVPEAAGRDSVQRTLALAQVSDQGSPDVYVGIDFVASSDASVSGHLGDENWVIEFKLRA